MPFNVATGTSTAAESVLPIDASSTPGVQQPTQTAGQLAGPTVDARDTTGEYQSQMAAAEGDARSALAAGMDARTAMLAHYEGDMVQAGPASYGDDLALPPVPAAATTSTNSFLYPEQGDEPTIAGGPFGGDEPQ